MFDLLNILGRREIDEWRDHWSMVAAMTLNDLAAGLIEALDKDIAAANWTDALVAQRGFVARVVQPRIKEAATPVVETIVAEANNTLRQLASHHAIWNDRPMAVETPDGTGAGMMDVALTAAPLAVGAATAAALPAMAVTSSSMLFGLLTVTAISWPVVIGGGAIAGVALAVGGFKSGGLKHRARDRLRKAVHLHVVATLIESDTKQPAILQQLVNLLGETAREAKRHRL